MISSSARHSAMDLTLRNADSRVYRRCLCEHAWMCQKMRAYTDGEEGDGLVNATQRRHIDGLATNGSLGANTGRVFTGTSVDNSIDENLRRNKYRKSYLNRPKRTWMGFWSDKRCMISKACATIRTARTFFPLLRPFIMRLCAMNIGTIEQLDERTSRRDVRQWASGPF